MENKGKELHIIIMVGSLRRESVNLKLAKVAQGMLPEDVTSELVLLHGIPVYNTDDEVNFPQIVIDMRVKIKAADGVLIAMPEYNFSIAGVLKNALDWLSRPPKLQPFDGKPMGMMGAGGLGGTARGQMHLRQVLFYFNAIVFARPEVLISMGEKKFDTEGNLTDEASKQQLEKFITAFVEFVRKMGV